MGELLVSTEFFTPREVAAAADVPEDRVDALIWTGQIASLRGGWITGAEALRAVRLLRPCRVVAHGAARERPLFQMPPRSRHSRGMPLVASATVHALAIFGLLVTTAHVPRAASDEPIAPPARPVRLVSLLQPGPGGGGGGGGRRERLAPPQAARRGASPSSRPVVPRDPAPATSPRNDPSRPLPNEPLPPLLASVVPAPGDRYDRAGVLDASLAAAESRGPGHGDGIGNGAGSGAGDGQGSGIGPGWGGGTGGGPYRPGGGIDPPRVVHEVRPEYSEAARRSNVEGEVLLEVVVQRDGSVGAVRVVRGLGYGLDERAVAAVRQWRFAPARRLGEPVDVLVEVAMEFRLR